MPIAYTNARIFTGNAIETKKAVLVQNGVIEDIVPENNIPERYTKEDLRGMYLVPAFIDLQIYGGQGQLFSQELNEAAIHATYAYALQGGCAHFMITMATNTIEKFRKGLAVAKKYWQSGGKGLLGVHLEGPYINPDKRGAHLQHCVKVPEEKEINLLLQEGGDAFKMMTLAPEQCSSAVIDLLLQNDVIVSAGHSNATYTEAMRAFHSGIPAATHLFNAMSPLHHRAPGLAGAVLDHPSVMSSIVCDGIHVDYATFRIAKKIMGNRLFFITDAVTEVREGEYQHIFNDDRYTLPNGILSGSALNMVQCVKNAVKHAGIPLDEALRMASAYPASLLKNDKIGNIKKGCKATMAVLDENLNLNRTIT